MNAEQRQAKTTLITVLEHAGIDLTDDDRRTADAIPSALSEAVAHWITRAYRAGQGALADDVRQLQRKVAALENANSDHGSPLPVDFDALREIAAKRSHS